MASGFQNIGKIPELRRRIFYTISLLAIYRIGAFVTTPGVNRSIMSKIVNQASGSFLGLFNMFSGGALSQMSIFALGIMPYISASIILQLLTVVVPKLEQIQKEGQAGQQKINQYTRYGCVLLSLVQSFFIARWLESNNRAYAQYGQVVIDPGWGFRLLTMVSLTTGTGATVAFAGGASPCNVYWQVGSSATIQTGNNFAGNIMALASITLNGGNLAGRALARNGTVTISAKETIISGCSSGTSGVPTVVVSPVNSSIVCGAAGSTITKTAVVLSNGVPVVGTTVTFTITGPDSGQSGTAITDATGTATFTIKAPAGCSGEDSIVATVNGGTVSSNTTFATFSGSGSGSFCSTAPSPTVALVSVTSGPPKQVVLSVQSAGGLSSVFVNTPPTTNATVSILPFDTGTTQALGVTATKINQSASAVIELTVIDLCGHTTVFDPVFATITIPAAGPRSKSNHVAKFDFDHWEVARFNGIGRTEGIVFLQNDTPGVESLVITVNGTPFRTKLADGKSKKIDISSALFHGKNKVTIAVFGDTGSSVDLSISDGK